MMTVLFGLISDYHWTNRSSLFVSLFQIYKFYLYCLLVTQCYHGIIRLKVKNLEADFKHCGRKDRIG